LVRKRLLAIVREIADSGTAVLVVEQSVRDVLLVADRAAVMRRGEIIDERAAVDWRDLEELGAMYLS
jgi:ABC-type branched-subunit amino acid transport system ATPase component